MSWIPKGWPKEQPRPGYTPTPADLTDEQEELAGADVDFDTLRAAEAARTEQDGKSLLPAKPTERARILHDGSQNQFARVGWSITLADGTHVTAVREAPPSETVPGTVLVKDADDVTYVSVPTSSPTFAKKSLVVAAYPNLNLIAATKKYVEDQS